jgi:hypothetical protein
MPAPHHGGQGGKEDEFDIGDGEHLIALEGSFDNYADFIRLITDKGRKKEFGKYNSPSGRALPRSEDLQGLPFLVKHTILAIIDGNLVPQPPGPNNIFLPAGTTMNGPHVGEDGAKLQCCIHPWMRITVNGDETHGDHQLGGH